MKVIFKVLLVVSAVATLVTSTATAATTTYASNHKGSSHSSSNSTGSGSKGSDISGSSSQGSSSSGSSNSGSDSGPTPASQSDSGNNPQSPDPPSNTSSLHSGSNNNNIPNSPTSSSNTPNSNSNPSNRHTTNGHTSDFDQGATQGANDGKIGVYDPAAACVGAKNDDHCITGYKDKYVEACSKSQLGCGDGPTTCPPGESSRDCSTGSSSPSPPAPSLQPCKGNLTCPKPQPLKLPDNCHRINNMTVICNNRIEHNSHSTINQVVPGLIANTNDISLFLVTTCTADQNNGVLNGNLAALCDSTITMMHNDGLNSLLPQVDMYLKTRGLLR